jgi:hypothetical protein
MREHGPVRMKKVKVKHKKPKKTHENKSNLINEKLYKMLETVT